MDLHGVERIRVPRRRAEIWPLGPSTALLAGGTWLFSEPQPDTRELVDLTGLGWPAVTLGEHGLELAATCTLAEVADLSARLPGLRPEYAAAPLFAQACAILLASFKVRHAATVGGNLCLAYPAGSMISLASVLDGDVLIWRRDGSDYRLPITEFVTGDCTHALPAGDVVRALLLPDAALRERTALRKLAPARLGRSGIVVMGRRNPAGTLVLSITAATVRPYVFRLPQPTLDAVRDVHASIPDDAWTDDPHGDPDWRRGVSLVLAQQVCEELG